MQILLASLYPFVFVLLFFTLPFDMYFRALPNILLVVLALLFPLVIKKEDFKKLKKIPTIVWVAFFLYLTLNATLLQGWQTDIEVLKKIGLAGALVLLYLPINDFKKLNKALIFSALATIIFSLLHLFVLLNKGFTFTFLESATLIEAILLDRIYLGFLCVLSILASYQLLKKEYHPDNKYYLINIIVNVLFILFIVSRIAIITLVVIFLISLFHQNKRGPQILFATGSIFLIAFFAFIINKDLRKKILYANQIENKGLIANTLAYEPRAILWDCALKISQEHQPLILGIGFRNTNNELIQCYQSSIKETYKKNWFLKQKYNVHNQFIDFYLATGVLGFLLFSLGIVTLFIRNRKSFYPSALVITLVCFALAENVFHRQIGAYFVGFVLISLLINNQKVITNKPIE